MASNKNKLHGLINTANASTPAPENIQRGTPYQVGATAPETEEELSPQVEALSVGLQDIAREYISARRKSGKALLEAARWLFEAHSIAKHGEWQVFLEATSTTPDTAERLINIHRQAMQNPQFAESVTRNWLSQSAAALLARPSTPSEVVEEVLSAEQPLSVVEVQQKIRQARKPEPQMIEQNPQFAESELRQFGEATQLTAQERASLAKVTTKVDQWLEDLDQLTAEDWELLSPLALRLSDLLRQVGRRRAGD